MICQQLQTSGLKQALHIITIKDNTNCQEMIQYNPLLDECGMCPTLQAAISVMVQMKQFMTYMRPDFEHGIHFFSLLRMDMYSHEEHKNHIV